MILSDLRDYIRQRNKVSMIDLVNHFNMDAGALRGMLGKWISKGKIKPSSPSASCGSGCCKCDPALTEFYEWVDE